MNQVKRNYFPTCALLLALFSLLPAAAAMAQSPPADPLERAIFPPELVMQNQERLGLTEAQRQEIVRELQQTQTDLVPLQMSMAEHAEALLSILADAHIDEGAALDAAGAVMALEVEVKKRHLALVIRVKNLLTEEQQAILTDLRSPKG